eukprot:jgi/Mesvir1/3573/Mv25312-RA.1
MAGRTVFTVLAGCAQANKHSHRPLPHVPLDMPPLSPIIPIVGRIHANGHAH